MLYFIVSTCILPNNVDFAIRKQQYAIGIITLLKQIQSFNIMCRCRVIIVENNGQRNTFLDDVIKPYVAFSSVYYTNNNALPTTNKGVKELKDVFDCMNEYKINDDDFIVKITGRYILNDDSEFMLRVKELVEDETKYDCIIKYGSYLKPVSYKTQDCITGLIGLRCKYVKQIAMPKENECVEWNWAKSTYNINDETKICQVNKLGISICPASNVYFNV